MPEIRLPNRWDPRRYQIPLWSYLERGGKRAVAVWHRRAGKDDVALHMTACMAMKRVGTYWHMLPQAAQARKAIWNAIDPHTGKRRIDTAFPTEIRAGKNEQEMLIRFINGSTWQVVGSDNFNSLVGSPPVGVVFSEYSIANPRAWDYIRPILLENGGWAVFIYTPRGKNHGYDLYRQAQRSEGWFAEKLGIGDTLAFDPVLIDEERNSGMTEDMIQQEYFCSFDAAITGAVYGQQMNELERLGRIRKDIFDPTLPVDTYWDLGRTDATVIWFVQTHYGEIRVIDFYENALKDIPHYADVLDERNVLKPGVASPHGRKYIYRHHIAPADANRKVLEAGDRSFVAQLYERGYRIQTVAATTQPNQIAAMRATLKHCWFDSETTDQGVECLKSYHFPWSDTLRRFADEPAHDWSSHASDALELMGQVWQKEHMLVADKPEPPPAPNTIRIRDNFLPTENPGNTRQRI